jgi:hypothetical protein
VSDTHKGYDCTHSFHLSFGFARIDGTVRSNYCCGNFSSISYICFLEILFVCRNVKLWVGWKLAEAELQHWAIGTGNVYLLLLLQLLENKVIINLTCSEFVEGQEVTKLSDWFFNLLFSSGD